MSKNFKALVFIIVYLVSPALLYILPASFYVPIQILYIVSNFFFVIGWNFKSKLILDREPLIFSLSLFSLAVVEVIFKDVHWTIPLFYLTGFISLVQFRNLDCIQSKMGKLIIASYLYFIIVYFSKLPGLFHRPGFNEDVFYVSSSNAIAIISNVYLFAYLIFGMYNKTLNRNRFILFGIVNFVLILIQKSRMGIVVALLICILPFIHNFRKLKYFGFFISIVILLIGYFLVLFVSDFTGEENLTVKGYEDDNRSIIQSIFFNGLDGETFFLGYPMKYEYLGYHTRLYNMFLLNYNYTTVIGFILLVLLILKRFLQSRKYNYHVFFLFPIILYGMVEEIFLPMGWDVILYLVFFLKSSEVSPNIKSQNKLGSLHT